MFESAMSTVIAPAGVGIFVLFAEYFFIRRAAILRKNPQQSLIIFASVILLFLSVFCVYQMNENHRKMKEIRALIRESYGVAEVSHE